MSAHHGPRYRDAHVGGCIEATIASAADGSVRITSTEALRWFPERLTDSLAQWAADAPDRTFVAKRRSGGEWERIGYAQMLQRARAIGQALLDRKLSVERPVAILSDNDLDHLSLALGAMWVGVPFAPISPAYSLVSQDFGKLRHILGTLTPGLVFATSPAFAKAIAAVVPADTEVVLVTVTWKGARSRPSARCWPLRPRRPWTPRSRPRARTPSPSSCSPAAAPRRPRA